ncbi:SIR2 family protein [Flavobacterium sp. FBOR7N2.3]|uniref:SIR2 family protein n=1 Tax=Flavobacterium magnesitis TaxID=3138077 RepID=A0ABV4TLR1_9FLAO
MAKLTIILGAGFSANAGFPLAQAVNERFNRNQTQKLLRMSSSEWLWKDDKDETTIHNGTIQADANIYSYVFNEVVNQYKLENGDFTDYEDFFQYVLTNSPKKEWYKNINEQAFNKYLGDHPHMNTSEGLEYLEYYRNSHHSIIIEIINYLVADLLFLKIPEDVILKFYKSFVDYIQQFDEVSIFTLNHDLLLEGILDYFGIKYSRGFSEKESPIFYEDNPLPAFNDDFSDSKIKIFKLHGSLDYYRFEETENSQLTGRYNYFSTRGYRAKHYARRVDFKTGKTIQEINSDIIPKFITGKNKPEIIKNDIMYSSLFNHFKNDISQAEHLLISGYSFRDEHINSELEKQKAMNVTNQRRTQNYPFSAKKINDIDSFDDLH